MKILFIVALLTPFIVFSQHSYKPGFAEFGPIVSIYNDNASAGGEFAISSNIKKSLFAIGAGLQVMQYKSNDNVYTPLYLDLRAYLTKADYPVRLFVTAQPGYGVFNYNPKKIPYSASGGFFFSGGIGCYFNAKKKAGPYLTAKYAQYNFQYTTSLKKTNEAVNALVIGVGMWLK